MLTQLPSVPSLIPSSFATRAIGRDVSITIFTASSLNSGEKLFFGRGNYLTFPDGPSYWTDCPEASGRPKESGEELLSAALKCVRDRWRATGYRFVPVSAGTQARVWHGRPEGPGLPEV